MASLNIGDVVKLKSGGPPMTVRELTTAKLSSSPDSPKDHVNCHWFDEQKAGHVARFPVAALDLDSGPQPSSN